MIDVHSHLLPGLDDGPRSWEEAIALCKLIAAEGVRVSVATPHLIDGVYENDSTRVRPLVEELQRRLQKAGVPLEVLPGAEVDFSSRRVAAGDETLPTLGRSRAVLLEMPVAVVPPAIDETIFSLRARGMVPVIAHPERNELLQEQPQMAGRWTQTGALLQLDADSLLGLWGRRTKRCAEALLALGLAHMLATDAHSCDRRPPRLREALARATEVVGPDARKLVEDAPAALLAGRTVVPPAGRAPSTGSSRSGARTSLLGRLFGKHRQAL